MTPRRIFWALHILLLALAAAMFWQVMTATSAGAARGDDHPQTCKDVTTPGSGGWWQKVDTTGDPATVTVTVPEGYLVDRYCVKAGNGDGAVQIIQVTPPARTVVIDHPDKDSVSHYVLHKVPVEETPPTTVDTPPTTVVAQPTTTTTVVEPPETTTTTAQDIPMFPPVEAPDEPRTTTTAGGFTPGPEPEVGGEITAPVETSSMSIERVIESPERTSATLPKTGPSRAEQTASVGILVLGIGVVLGICAWWSRRHPELES